MYSYFNLREVYAVYVVCCTDILAGVVYGFSAQLMPYLQSSSSDMKLQAHELSWIATTGLLGRPIGSLIDIFLIDTLGRRGTLRLTTAISIVGWATIAFAPNFIALCIGRTITSIAIGMIAASAVYVAEFARPAYRSLLLTVMALWFLIGLGVIYVLNYFLYWRVVAGILSISCIVFLLQLYTIPESVYWHVRKKQYEKARDAYKWIMRCNDELVDEKMKEIQESFKTTKDNSSFFSNLKKSSVYQPFLIIFSINLFRMGTGIEVFYGYSVHMYQELHTPYDVDSIVASFGIVNIFVAIGSCFLVFKFEKRTIIVICTLIMNLSMAYVLICEELLSSWNVNVEIPSLKVFCFSLFMTLGNAIIGQIVWSLVAELSPSCVRGQMFAITTFFMFTGSLLMTQLYGTFGLYISFKWTLLIMFLCNSGVFIISYLFLPETKGKSILEIEQYFSK